MVDNNKMRMDYENLLERSGGNFSELNNRVDALEQGASTFETVHEHKKRMQWEANKKLMIITGIVAVVIVIILGKSARFNSGIFLMFPSKIT